MCFVLPDRVNQHFGAISSNTGFGLGLVSYLASEFFLPLVTPRVLYGVACVVLSRRDVFAVVGLMPARRVFA